MSCKTMRRYVSLDLDGRLREPLKTDLSRHLQSCPQCAAWQILQLDVKTLLAEPVSQTIPPGMMEQLENRIQAELPQRVMPIFIRPRLRTLALQAAMFLFFLLAVTAGLKIGSRPQVESYSTNSGAFNATLGLDFFTDLPRESFGAVYASLLQGDRP